MSTNVRRVLIALPIVLMAAAIPVWCARREPPQVEAVAVRRAPLRVIVSTNGKIEPIDDVDVRARLDGRVVDIPDPGKRVQQGEVVARFDEGPVAGELAAAESERLSALESLRAARAVADERRDRVRTDRRLFEGGAMTREAYATSERAAAEASAHVRHLEREVPLRVAALEKRIAELQAQRDATVVRAPISGTIYKTAAKKGEMVRIGAPLLSIADLDRLRVRANIDQVDLGRVRPGQDVRISANAFPGREWTGKISEIVPNVVVKESRAVAESLASLDPPVEGLVPGMTADVEITVAEDADALQVPAEAVINDGDQSYVYRVTGRRLRKAPVRTGLSSVSAVAIEEGLPDDALVVVGPTTGLDDGMRITAKRRDQ
ncbi:MAG: efflux RND transporter periplasmic adaptor subunit [Candidatus Binatia bacterium]